MKKVLCLLTALVMVFGCVGINASAAEYGAVLNNNVALMVGSTTAVARNALQTLSAAPIEVDGVVLVPLSAVSALFNGTVNYDSSSGYIDIRFGVEKAVEMCVGSTSYTCNGKGYSFEVAPRVEGSEVMIPLRSLVQTVLGQVYFFDDATKLAVISSRGVIKDSATDAAVIAIIAGAIRSNNLPPISVPTSYQIDWSVEEAPIVATGGNSGAAASVATEPAIPASVTASQEPEPDNNAQMAFDGDIGTRWACDGDGSITADLGSAKTISEIRIAWWKWDERNANYGVEISTDGSNFTSIFSGAAVGQMYETHNVNQSARYVRIQSHGNNSSNWNSLLECEIMVPAGSVGAASGSSAASGGGKLSAPTGSKLSVNSSMVKVSAEPESNNPGAAAVDGNASTYWAVENANNLVIDLGSAQSLSAVGVQMRAYDDGRSVKYGIEVSEDGAAYTSVFSGQSPAGGAVMEYYSVGKSARFVRINVNGSTTNGWASLAEVEVYAGAAGAAGGAQAGAVSGYPNMSSVNGEFIITAAGTTNAITVGGDNLTLSLAPYTKSNNQIWSKTNNSYGDAILSKSAGIVMDVSEQSMDEGGQIIVWEGNGGNNQAWVFELDGDGYYIKSVMSGLYLSASGTSIQQLSRQRATKWAVAGPNASVITTGGAAVGAGGYENMTSVSGEFVIAAQGSTNVITVESDNLTLSLRNNTKNANQIWTKGTNSYGETLQNKGAGIVMDVSEQSMNEGGQIIVWEGNDGNNQSWALELDGDGYYIRSVMSGLYLTANSGSIQQMSRQNATKWTISRPDAEVIMPEGVSVIAGEFTLTASGTNQALTVGDDKLTLSLTANSKSRSQLWTRASNSYGDSLQSVSAGLMMDVSDQSMDEGGNIIVWEGNDGNNQAWAFEQDGDGYYIRSIMSGLYLTADTSGIVQKSRSSATKWIVEGDKVETVVYVDPNTPTAISTPVEGRFKLAVYGTNDVVTINKDDTYVGVEAYFELPSQIWTMVSGSNGMIIKNAADGRAIEIPRESVDPAMRAGVWDDNDGAHQSWIFEKLGNFYYIKNVNSGLYLSYDNTGLRQKDFAYATKWAIRPVK